MRENGSMFGVAKKKKKSELSGLTLTSIALKITSGCRGDRTAVSPISELTAFRMEL